MEVHMLKNFYKVLLFIFLSHLLVTAQTGRISGKVVDKQTGEPLIGANVIVLGTSLGAATNVNGEYIINNVYAGTYSVRASFIGYQDVTVQNIVVNAGLTTRLNFELSSKEIATQEIVIISKRPLIEKTATNAIRIVDFESLEKIPTRDLNSIVALQPGVVQQNGLIFIRGSRPDETGYLVEGTDVKNVLNRRGGSLVSVIPDAIQELTVQAGGYTAEFGNANAGIVSSEFKTGSSRYQYSMRVETDNFGNYPGKTFLGTYSYGYSDLVLTASGPVPTLSDKLKFFVSVENAFQRDQPKFFSGNPERYSDGALWDTTKVYDSGFYGGSKDEYQILKWGPANIPGNFSNRYTTNGTLLFDNNPLLLRLATAFTWSRNTPQLNDIRSIFNVARIPYTDQSNLLLNLKGTYLLSQKSFLEASVSYYDFRSKTYDPNFKDDFLLYSDSLAASRFGWKYSNYTTPPPPYDFYGFPFDRPGSDRLVFYSKDHNNYISANVAYTNQLGVHALKLGGSYQTWTIRRWRHTNPSNFLTTVRNNPDQARDSLAALIGASLYQDFDNYGYDVFGNETNESGLFAPKKPVFASMYLVDRIEVNDLIVNAGLRYDYFDMDSWAWTNPQLPVIDRQTHLIPDSAITKSKAVDFVSPRLGFAFPVTDRTVFHLQYGKFIQSPTLDFAYRGVYQATRQLQGANLFVNPIAYNPGPIRTTQYEVGFSHQFNDYAALDITAFYKDIKGQLQYAVVNTLPGAPRAKYAVFANQDFATTKGVELSLRLRRINRISATVYYTFSNSLGTNSLSNSGLGSTEVNGNVPTVLTPLDYNQTHRGSIIFDYRFDKDDGGPILERSGINILFTFNSGHPYTLAQWTGLGQASAWTGGLTPIGSGDTRGRRPVGPINSATTPWNYNFDLRIDKTVTIARVDFNFYVYVQNVFNTKNVINVYDKTGNAYNDGFLDTPDGRQIISGSRYTERFADLYRALNYENRMAAFNVYGYDLFGQPRQLRVGVLVNY